MVIWLAAPPPWLSSLASYLPGRRGWPHGYCAWLWSERPSFAPWLGTLCCVLGWDTLLSQCLSPPRCINGYRQIVGETWKIAGISTGSYEPVLAPRLHFCLCLWREALLLCSNNTYMQCSNARLLDSEGSGHLNELSLNNSVSSFSRRIISWKLTYSCARVKQVRAV